jgi:diadenosine tetraphosphate (Ap4A) HIT family hydrolase
MGALAYRDVEELASNQAAVLSRLSGPGWLKEGRVSLDCMACQLTAGERDLLGGRIFQTEHWVVEHCIGTPGVGTLILKPLRHIVGLADKSDAEAADLGPLMQRATSIIKALTDSDQVYACLWSHADWTPGHIHFVLQPAWNALRSRYPGPGPALQMGDVHGSPGR